MKSPVPVTNDSLRKCYNEVICLLANHPYAGFIEPFEHVEEVERLRWRYCQPGQAKAVLVAESPVRVANLTRGVGFVGEPRYYTPWWHSLFIPAFSAMSKKTTTVIRHSYLQAMGEAGFCVLDLSVISLSGYKKVGAPVSRPFDQQCVNQIMGCCWQYYVGAIYGQMVNKPKPPLIVAFDNAAKHLPESPKCRLKFETASNARIYRQPHYEWGTNVFSQAMSRGRLSKCLTNIETTIC